MPLRVAVMGCVVNGPGEAREADLGVASGNGKGQIFVKGEVDQDRARVEDRRDPDRGGDADRRVAWRTPSRAAPRSPSADAGVGSRRGAPVGFRRAHSAGIPPVLGPEDLGRGRRAARAGPGVNVVARLPRPAHPAPPPLARRRDVGLVRGRRAGLGSATARPTWSRRWRRPRRSRRSPSGRRRAAPHAPRPCSGPQDAVEPLWERLAPSVAGAARRTARAAAPGDRRGPRWSTPDPRVRRSPLRRARDASTRPAWRCTPRRSGSPRRSGRRRRPLPRPGRPADLARAGRSSASRTGGCVFKAEVAAATPYACQVQDVYVDPERRGEGLGTAGMAAVVEHRAARDRAGGLALRQRPQPRRPGGPTRGSASSRPRPSPPSCSEAAPSGPAGAPLGCRHALCSDPPSLLATSPCWPASSASPARSTWSGRGPTSR